MTKKNKERKNFALECENKEVKCKPLNPICAFEQSLSINFNKLNYMKCKHKFVLKQH